MLVLLDVEIASVIGTLEILNHEILRDLPRVSEGKPLDASADS